MLLRQDVVSEALERLRQRVRREESGTSKETLAVAVARTPLLDDTGD